MLKLNVMSVRRQLAFAVSELGYVRLVPGVLVALALAAAQAVAAVGDVLINVVLCHQPPSIGAAALADREKNIRTIARILAMSQPVYNGCR